jgi:prepilin-type N-terminal cleavage/methylation domain-containing protein/prepilin-type processing-associated H-X9-DG protein
MQVVHRGRNRRGFTLIELLITITIISLLAAILFPVFGRARANARRSACLSNMKQLGLGLMQYTQDYDERLPGNEVAAGGINQPQGWLQPATPGVPETYRNWAREIMPYVKSTQIYMCGESKPRSQDGPAGGTTEVPAPGGNTNYLMNGVVDSVGLSTIQSPADLIFLHEVRNFNRVAQVRPTRIAGSNPPQATTFQHAYYDRLHFDGANLLFCDGHVKWQRRDSIRFAQFGAPVALNPSMPTHLALDDTAATNNLSLTLNLDF